MAEVIKMPRMSDTMTEGVIVAWHKKVGDKIKSGDLLAEIETDKAVMEFESFQDGILLYIGAEKGAAVPVDTVIAVLGKEGEDYNVALANAGNVAPTPEVKKDLSAETSVKDEEVPVAKEIKTETPVAAPASTSNDLSAEASAKAERVKASPLAKKIAEEKGVDISTVKGSGDDGRIVKRDIENLSATTKTTETKVAAQPVIPFVAAGTESFEEVAVSQMRKTIAKRLSESKNTAPHFYLTVEINMDNAIASRKNILDATGIKVSFNDFVIKACAMSLRKNPKVNSSWLGDKIRYNHHIHIGMAVAVEDGLLVPVIRFADQKSFSQINAEAKNFAQKAKEKKLQPTDWEGNTFTVSNLGMFDIDNFTAIINPPDACILAVGTIKETAGVVNGEIKIVNIMKVTLSCDHRVVDGATGAQFLQTLKSYLENPVAMLA